MGGGISGWQGTEAGQAGHGRACTCAACHRCAERSDAARPASTSRRRSTHVAAHQRQHHAEQQAQRAARAQQQDGQAPEQHVDRLRQLAPGGQGRVRGVDHLAPLLPRRLLSRCRRVRLRGGACSGAAGTRGVKRAGKRAAVPGGRQPCSAAAAMLAQPGTSAGQTADGGARNSRSTSRHRCMQPQLELTLRQQAQRHRQAGKSILQRVLRGASTRSLRWCSGVLHKRSTDRARRGYFEDGMRQQHLTPLNKAGSKAVLEAGRRRAGQGGWRRRAAAGRCVAPRPPHGRPLHRQWPHTG